MEFSEITLHAQLHANLTRMGYTETTPVQEQAIPALLEGRDVVAQAQTGTGKTAAFGIPMVQLTDRDADGVLGLILVPTRELAAQVTGVLADFARGLGIEVISVYGGGGMRQQLDQLHRRGPKIVVATPGRLMDHMERFNLDVSKVRMLVLDEADRMLDMGFIPDIRTIGQALTGLKQTALLSATIGRGVRELLDELTSEPVHVKIESQHVAVNIDQFVSFMDFTEKDEALLNLLVEEQPDRAVIFTRMKHRADQLAELLNEHGWSSVSLQGDMSQHVRDQHMRGFREGRARCLVATDVAARGLDVDGITHVINYELPEEAENYVHRVGRTARNGASGRAFNLVERREVRLLRFIEMKRDPMTQVAIPTRESGARGPDGRYQEIERPRGRRPNQYGGGRQHGGNRGNYGGGRSNYGGGRGGNRNEQSNWNEGGNEGRRQSYGRPSGRHGHDDRPRQDRGRGRDDSYSNDRPRQERSWQPNHGARRSTRW